MGVNPLTADRLVGYIGTLEGGKAAIATHRLYQYNYSYLPLLMLIESNYMIH